ncbi:hypothetical protein B0H15DRAFT_957019 [Mycena belliarum]|uniref:Uncharacterized protein n=1 Tax=Mycena belliarum TaxID=1033014 RepID=A0AAD6XIU2_9AGAR|nr:hypothetical protein B0H15DRAFT_957019 [Mycena belliae]
MAIGGPPRGLLPPSTGARLATEAPGTPRTLTPLLRPCSDLPDSALAEDCGDFVAPIPFATRPTSLDTRHPYVSPGRTICNVSTARNFFSRALASQVGLRCTPRTRWIAQSSNPDAPHALAIQKRLRAIRDATLRLHSVRPIWRTTIQICHSFGRARVGDRPAAAPLRPLTITPYPSKPSEAPALQAYAPQRAASGTTPMRVLSSAQVASQLRLRIPATRRGRSAVYLLRAPAHAALVCKSTWHRRDAVSPNGPCIDVAAPTPSRTLHPSACRVRSAAQGSVGTRGSVLCHGGVSAAFERGIANARRARFSLSASPRTLPRRRFCAARYLGGPALKDSPAALVRNSTDGARDASPRRQGGGRADVA